MRKTDRMTIISLITAILLLFFALYQQGQEHKAAVTSLVSKTDTVYLKPDTVYISDIKDMVIYVEDSALIRRCNEMHSKYQVAKLQLRDIDNYVAICRRRPDQTKFLVGWITRRLR